jgi:hypothetical protein
MYITIYPSYVMSMHEHVMLPLKYYRLMPVILATQEAEIRRVMV